jgi:hypothetical protein
MVVMAMQWVWGMVVMLGEVRRRDPMTSRGWLGVGAVRDSGLGRAFGFGQTAHDVVV